MKVGGLAERAEWRNNITSTADEAGYYACIENGLSFGTLSGDGGVGTHGGSEDHAAILTAHLASSRRSRSCRCVRSPRWAMRSPWTFVLTPSGVAAQKAGTAREAYNRLAEGTRVLLDLWNREPRPGVGSLGAALMSEDITLGSVASSAAVDRLRALIRRLERSWLEAPGTWNAGSIISSARIRGSRRPWRRLNAVMSPRLGQLAADSQSDAESLLGNQIPETTVLPRAARALGAIASRSFGAGFGGSVWALVERSRAEEFARRWTPDAFVAAPGPALVELTCEGSPKR